MRKLASIVHVLLLCSSRLTTQCIFMLNEAKVLKDQSKREIPLFTILTQQKLFCIFRVSLQKRAIFCVHKTVMPLFSTETSS